MPYESESDEGGDEKGPESETDGDGLSDEGAAQDAAARGVAAENERPRRCESISDGERHRGGVIRSERGRGAVV